MQNRKYISFLIVSVIATGILIAAPALAQSGPGFGWGKGGGARNGMGVFGTVATNDGSTLTITSKPRPNRGNASSTATTTPVTYTVSTTSATTVTKNAATSSVSAISVGDIVMVQGTVSGTNVAATAIRDGMMGGARQLPVIQGNGQPVVAGKITAISGNTITITNSSKVTYTIDVTNAKILVGNQASSISSLAAGDNTIVQGTINGTSVIASSVIDQKPKPNSNSNNTNNNQKPQGGFMGGIFGGIGNFFKKLFGF
jgi:hypothetical protein